uniref:glucan endo-1,3-beta-D-glucosidase n=1 Tax=Moniliophthora roreri TaxID=221103 RepID=A0A0W0EUR7_MONRR
MRSTGPGVETNGTNLASYAPPACSSQHSPSPPYARWSLWMYSQYRDNPSRPSLQDYYNDGIPPAHRLSDTPVQYNDQNIPLTNQGVYGSVPRAGDSGDLGQYYDNDNEHRGSHSYSNLPAGTAAGVGLGAAAAAATEPTFRKPHFGDTRQYTDRDANENWLADQRKSSKRSKGLIIGGVVLLLIIIIVAVVAGVLVSKRNSNSSSSADIDNASSFAKDSRLKKSFYGIAYTPEGALLPDCGAKLENVVKDVQLLSQLTTVSFAHQSRLHLALNLICRSESAYTDQTAISQRSWQLDAIERTKVDLNVYIANYPIATDNNAAYERQRDAMKDALQKFGADHVAGVTVGNEFILNYLNANGGGSDPNRLNLNKTLPIGNADAGSYFNNEVLQAVNYGMSNVHAWFANVSIDDAAAWTWEFFQDTNVAVANQLPNQPSMSIAETGWPTKSSDKGNESNGASVASVENLQKFIDTFVCQANQNGTQYFFFEFTDEPWKDQQFGGVEGWWGLFNSDRTLKNINIPDCPAP